MTKILSVVGARPQFVKCALVSKELRKRSQEILVHTGQHYDDAMSQVFFQELEIPVPDYNLNVGSGTHAQQTGEMLRGIEEVLTVEIPDMVLVYGDTNSTLSGALVAAKLNTPVGHIEAGLRSFNRQMPEEINRIITDRISSLLFCPCQRAIENLEKEGISRGVVETGDVMYDVLIQSLSIAERRSQILDKLGLSAKTYYLATVHRASNTDLSENLSAILTAFDMLDQIVVFPVHPRTRKTLKQLDINCNNVVFTEPVSYFDMLVLIKNALKVLTDSGGVQKEAFFLKIPCVTLREETEWIETLEDGWNRLAGTDIERITAFAKEGFLTTSQKDFYGDGMAHLKIVRYIEEFFSNCSSLLPPRHRGH